MEAIKCLNWEVYNFENAIRGMRHSFSSGDKMDSYVELVAPFELYGKEFVFGVKDHKLAMALAHAKTSGENKFMRQILVSVDITAPEYWWAEMDTYKVGTVANSTSTMHTLGKLVDGKPPVLNAYDHFQFDQPDHPLVQEYLSIINRSIVAWHEAGMKKPSPEWRMMIQLLARSWKYLRTYTTNYAAIQNVYRQRKLHRLEEWHQFCDWVKQLPYSELITGEEKK